MRTATGTKLAVLSRAHNASRFASRRCLSVSPRVLDRESGPDLQAILRVDHAGEVGANWIYKGQIAILGADPSLRPLLDHMLEQERVHLEKFDGLLAEHRVRPSLLRPLWESAGFALGAATAVMGKEAAMCCTDAVETAIGEHYNDQIRELLSKEHNDLDLVETIRRFRDEELEHRSIAIENGSQKAPFYTILSAAIENGCRAAIWVAKRV